MKSGAFTTGLTDFHLLATTFISACVTKGKPNTFYYHHYENMNIVNVRDDLLKSIVT